MGQPIWSVPLPEGAEPPIEVYVNSVRLTPGDDFTIDGRWLRLTRAVKPQPQLGFWRRVMLGAGIGVYGDLKGDQVDVSFRRRGVTELASDLPVLPPRDGPPG